MTNKIKKVPVYEQLVDEVFVISRIIKVEIEVLITLTETLIILDFKKKGI